MDLGFAGLVEKIEERFGKWAGTSIMAILCFIILAWGIKLFLGIFFDIENMIASADGAEKIFGIILSLSLWGVVSFFVGYIVMGFIERPFERKLAAAAKLKEEIETQMAEFRQEEAATDEKWNSRFAELDAYQRRIDKNFEKLGMKEDDQS